MKQRRLGKHGPMISPIGIGAMSFSNFYGQTSEADSHAILNTALDEGVTHITFQFDSKYSQRMNEVLAIAQKALSRASA